MKFVADEMLGKLARWLRVMGLDIVHRRPFPDSALIETARSENMIILTRDSKILGENERARRRSPGGNPDMIEVWAVEEDLPFYQMVSIVRRMNLDPLERAFTRCAACNGSLIERTGKEVEGRVPPFVFANVKEYRECLSCNKIYWAGTHRARIERILAEVKEAASEPMT